MESYLHPSSEDIRVSTSPRRSPQITEALTSPARSFHPQIQQMDSMHSQPDYGLRTTDFFDDTSDDESAKALSSHDVVTANDLLAHQGIASKKRHSGLPDEPFVSQCEGKGGSPNPSHNEGYQPLTGSATHEDDNRVADTPSSSLVGSVDELLPGGQSSPPRFPQRPRNPNVRAARHSANMEGAGDRTSRIDQTLGAYAIAHDITLQALMRDESALDRSLQSFPLTPLQSGDRQSLLPASLHREIDSRSPRNRPFSSPPEIKRVHVVPPPIDTSAPRRSLPGDIVRTPYPFSPEPAHHKNGNREKNATYAGRPILTTESVLTLSIRQSNPNSKRRVTSLTIPASNDFSVVRSHSPRSKEQHFKALDFDDEALFQQVRKCYRELIGPMRTLSARSLRRISVSGSAMQEADRGYWLHSPRSPARIGQKNLRGTFSEERIMQYHRKPALGKSRYAFVHWAHRLAAAPSIRTPRPGEDSADSFGRDMVPRMEHTEGLEFVVCWSVARIAVALLFVLTISTATTLLWIFLGHVTVASSPAQGGYHDAGDRVTSGVVMGICLLLLGFSSIAGWLGVSWLVM